MDDLISIAGTAETGKRGRIATRSHGEILSSPLPPASASPLLRVTILLLSLLLLTACSAPVRVEWRTETEMNTAGFNLFRGESPDGPFDVKVNEQLIPPSTDPLTGKAYSYIDGSAQPGVTYYYELQEIEKSGQVNSYGPISVRAGGLAWWHVPTLLLLGAVVLFVWARGGASRR